MKRNFASISNKFVKPNISAGPSIFNRCDLRVAKIVHSELCPITRSLLQLELDLGSKTVLKELYLNKSLNYNFYDFEDLKLKNEGPIVPVLVNQRSYAPDETHNYQILVI